MQIQKNSSAPFRSSALWLLLAVGTLLGVGTTTAKLSPIFGWSPLAVLQWAMLGGGVFQVLSLMVRGGGTECIQKSCSIFDWHRYFDCFAQCCRLRSS